MAVERYHLYIDGESTPPTGGRHFATIDPATGEAWAEVAKASALSRQGVIPTVLIIDPL